MIYLDNCATTAIQPSAAEIWLNLQTENYFNSSASYGAALKNDKLLQTCRAALAETIGATAKEIFFTSGGSESDNTALFGAFNPRKPGVIISATEHSAVYEAAMKLKKLGAVITVARCDENGVASVEDFAANAANACIAAVMHVNNETGTVNPVAEIARAVKSVNPECIVFSDGVQAHMRIKTDVRKLGVDMYSGSAHKIHGPKGVGFLYVKSGTVLHPLIYGGGQQDGMRSGTVNLPGIAAYAEACRLYTPQITERITELKSQLIKRLNCVVNSADCLTAPHIISAAFEGVQASTLQNALEEQGVIVGKGSACSSSSSRLSRTLTAMGIKKSLAEGTVRISLGAFNTADEMSEAADIINRTAERLAKFRRK